MYFYQYHVCNISCFFIVCLSCISRCILTPANQSIKKNIVVVLNTASTSLSTNSHEEGRRKLGKSHKAGNGNATRGIVWLGRIHWPVIMCTLCSLRSSC